MEIITELPLSLHAVVSNDDLLIEILLRLPIFSLVLFKSVSKRWLSLITNTNFTFCRSQIPNLDPPSGMFLRRPNGGYDLMSFNIRILTNKTFSFLNDADNAIILQSCNGLLLCSISSKFYIYNPSINMYKMIPHRSGPIHIHDKIRMAFDPTKSPHYKLVHARLIDGSVLIQTYTSQTGNWSVCGKLFPKKDFVKFHSGIYWNDAIHWVNYGNRVPLHFKLVVDHTVLTRIPIPEILDGKIYRKLFESRGCLLLASVCTNYTHSDSYSRKYLIVYEMINWYSGWSLKYFVNLEDIMMPARLVCDSIWYTVLGEREEDSFIVMKSYENLVEYKFELKTLRKLYDLESTHLTPTFQFIASFASV